MGWGCDGDRDGQHAALPCPHRPTVSSSNNNNNHHNHPIWGWVGLAQRDGLDGPQIPGLSAYILYSTCSIIEY